MKNKLVLLLTILLMQLFTFKSIHAAQTKAPKNSENVAQEDLNPNHYFLPEKSPLKKILNKIFLNPQVLKNKTTFHAAGFQTVFFRKQTNNLRIAKHPLLPGYLFKLYLKEERVLPFQEEQVGLIRRAFIASEIRKIVQQHKLTSITVADKWIYKLPQYKGEKAQTTYVLVVKDMQLAKRSKSEKMWRDKATRAQLRELHHILGAGYASASIVRNIPYTKSKKFACIDTEYSKQQFPLKKLKRHFSRKNKKRWKKICNGK